MTAARFDEITEGQCVKYQAVFDDYSRQLNSNIDAIMQACEKEFQYLYKTPHSSSGYWGSSALRKLKRYQTELSKAIQSSDPFEQIKKIYQKVEKDYGRSNLASGIMPFVGVAVMFLILLAMLIAMPQIAALGAAAGLGIALAGVVVAVAAIVYGGYSASSKKTESNSFKNVLTLFRRKFPTFDSESKPSAETTPAMTSLSLTN